MTKITIGIKVKPWFKWYIRVFAVFALLFGLQPGRVFNWFAGRGLVPYIKDANHG